MPPNSALDIQDLVFAYQGSDWQLSLASLSLDNADQMLLSAGSGHGKSTLLQLICGLLDPTSGEILVAGQDIHALRGHKRDLFRGGHIGMIFQTFNLLHGFSAVENVMAAMMFSDIPRREHQPRAMELLAHLGIERPHADPDQLSVGQQQRVAVARALACDPKIVLADEPTASLDPENASVAIELIQNACRQKGAALLCTSHDPAVAERFENRAVLDDLAVTSALS